MKRFRIHIGDRKDQTRALVEVMKRGRITCLRGDDFIVPEPALSFLDEIGVTYKVLNEEQSEEPFGPLRDSAAAAR